MMPEPQHARSEHAVAIHARTASVMLCEGPGPFDYDHAGNRTGHTARDGIERRYVVDAASQLARITVEVPGQGTTDLEVFAHDATGHRFLRQEGSAPGSWTSEARYFGEWVEQRGGEAIRLVHGGGIDRVLAEVPAGGGARGGMEPDDGWRKEHAP